MPNERVQEYRRRVGIRRRTAGAARMVRTLRAELRTERGVALRIAQSDNAGQTSLYSTDTRQVELRFERSVKGETGQRRCPSPPLTLGG